MNANRDASQRTKNIRAKTLAANYHETMNNINTATVMPVPRCYSDMSSSIHTQVVVGKMDCCAPITSAPVISYTTYYATFTTTGSTTWTAPATCQSPITYWIVGGGGGGGGAHDNAGAGGGGGGVAITGTYAVVAGTTYSIVVGAGGAGGTAIGSTHPNPNVTPGSSTDGSAGTNSSFDLAGGGPVAAGGGAGLRRGNNTHAGGGDGGVVSTGGYGGDGGNGGGGGGGAGGSGTNGGAYSAGTGGTGISFTIPGYNGGNPQTYSTGGNGGTNINTNFSYDIGISGSANTGNGGQGGGVGSFSPPYTGGVITVGGEGGSGLVVIRYSA
jgi:hypothetical protein